MKYERLNGISSLSVKKTTGKSWKMWVNIIDRKGGGNLSHKEIAKMIYEIYLKNHWGPSNSSDKTAQWWAQMVTVGYEYAKGRRVLGGTINQGFEIGVQKIIHTNQQKLWKFLNSLKGKSIWLGKNEFELRTKKENERLRLIYKDSTLQISLFCNRNTPDKTNLRFHQEKLKSSEEREKMKRHWSGILNKISQIFH